MLILKRTHSRCIMKMMANLLQGLFALVRNNCDENRFTGINLNLKKEAVIDTWQDSSPRYRVSVQFLVESGLTASDKIDVHVSLCGNFLEIIKPVSEFVTDVDHLDAILNL